MRFTQFNVPLCFAQTQAVEDTYSVGNTPYLVGICEAADVAVYGRLKWRTTYVGANRLLTCDPELNQCTLSSCNLHGCKCFITTCFYSAVPLLGSSNATWYLSRMVALAGLAFEEGD